VNRPDNPDEHLILSRNGRVQFGDVVVADTLVAPCPGMLVGGHLLTITMYRGPAQRFYWRTPESDRLRSAMVPPGSAFIDSAGEPSWARWLEPASMLVVGLKHEFAAKLATTLELEGVRLITQRGIDDQTIRYFATLFEQELANGGAHGRLYLESLTEALTINLFCRFAEQRPRRRPARGGLSPASLRRVLDYIESRLSEDIGLTELANIVGLSTHHFGQAFKGSLGISPYRYVVEQRIHRARQLLLFDDRPIADIAVEVGFANQSHFTFNFRRLIGTTPARLRRSLSGLPSRPVRTRR
jgi:AraC family transcriptional regulator